MKPRTLLFLTSGFGDNLLTLPLALELENQTRLSCVVIKGPQADFFAACLPQARMILYDRSVSALIRVLLHGFKALTWVYPIGACTRKLRLLHLLAFFRRAIGFTSLVSHKAWQAEIGIETCLMPDLAQRAWKNNLRLLSQLGLEGSFGWDHYTEILKLRLSREKHVPGRLIIHCGSARYAGGIERYKRWPLERFKTVVDGLLESLTFDQACWVLGPDDADLNGPLATLIENSAKHRIVSYKEFQGSLIQMGAFLASAEYMLSNDSGLAHLASLYNVPLTSLSSGIGEPSYTGQNGSHSDVVMAPTPCYGCCVGISEKDALAFTCRHEWACMDKITVDYVLQRIRDQKTSRPILAN